MAIAFGTVSNTTYASRTNTTITAPSGIANGDILILYHFIGSADETVVRDNVSLPSGFTQLSTSTKVRDNGFFYGYGRVAWKLASSESGDYTVTHSTGSTQAIVARYTGADASPFSPTPTKEWLSVADVHGDGVGGGVDGTISETNTLTTGEDNQMIVIMGHNWGDATPPQCATPGGTTPTFTERVDSTVVNWSDGVYSATAATGDKSYTNSNSAGNPWGSFMLALTPDTAGATFKWWMKKQFNGGFRELTGGFDG